MLQGFRNFFADPSGGTDRDALDWFLLIGFIMVCIVAWKLILRHILAD